MEKALEVVGVKGFLIWILKLHGPGMVRTQYLVHLSELDLKLHALVYVLVKLVYFADFEAAATKQKGLSPRLGNLVGLELTRKRLHLSSYEN